MPEPLETKKEKVSLVERFFILWDRIGILLAFIVVCILFGILTPVFFNPLNILNVIRQVSIIGVIAVGMTFVILLGGIDLSVGSVVAFTGIIAAGFQVKWGGSLFLSIVIPLLIGGGIGFLNGFISTKGGLHPFIVTLGTMSIFRGATLLVAKGRPISGMSRSFRFIGAGMIGPIPFPVILFLGSVIIAAIILRRTVFGRYIYAIGGNEEAALLSGIRVDRYKISAFTILGFLSALSGLILTSRLNSGELVAGEGYELDVIASVVIGGTSMMGGEGGVYGTLIGALLIGVISNGLNLLGVQPYWQMIVRGSIIILAVLMDKMKRRFR
ncbi:MAG: ABC transporter permease, partial [Atribacterales bacterium]